MTPCWAGSWARSAGSRGFGARVSSIALQNYLASGPFAAWVPVVLGVIFVTCVLSFRRGVVGELRAFIRRSF